MPVEQGLGDLVGVGLEGEGAIGHAGDGLKDDGVVRGVVCVLAPDKGSMAGDEAGGYGERVDGAAVLFASGVAVGGYGAERVEIGRGVRGMGCRGVGDETTEAADDGKAGLMDVAAADGDVGEWVCAGDGAVEVVGVGGAEGGDGHAGLSEGGGVLGVGVDDGTDGWELAVQKGVGVEIGGGAEATLDDVAHEIGDDHVLGTEVVVVDTGGLDHDKSLLAIDSGGVAEGVEDEASLDELEIGFKDLFTELLEEHDVLPMGARGFWACVRPADPKDRTAGNGVHRERAGDLPLPVDYGDGR